MLQITNFHFKEINYVISSYKAEKQDLKDLTQFAKLENTEISTNFLIEFLVKELKNELKTLKNESENKIIY